MLCSMVITMSKGSRQRSVADRKAFNDEYDRIFNSEPEGYRDFIEVLYALDGPVPDDTADQPNGTTPKDSVA